MNRVAIVMAYYDNPDMLREHLRVWSTYDPALLPYLSVVIVDDASPRYPALDVLSAGLPLSTMLWRVREDIPWHQDGARNIAMHHCPAEWALMTDMDHVLPADQVLPMLLMNAMHGEYYMPGQRMLDGTVLRPHPNTYMMSRSDFWRMGGYDEDFCGWYGSDGNFRKCARGAGLVERSSGDFGLVVYRDTDIYDANTKGLGRKLSPLHSSNNPKLLAKSRGPAYKATRPLRIAHDRLI